MFGLKFKKDEDAETVAKKTEETEIAADKTEETAEITETAKTVENKEEIAEEQTVGDRLSEQPVEEKSEEACAPLTVCEEKPYIVPVSKKAIKAADEKIDAKKSVTEFSRLADILNKDEDAIIDECKLFQIRNIMSRLSRALVRHGLDGENTRTLVKNAIKSGLGEIAAAPVYIDGVAKSIKAGEDVKVCAVVDFPFGESSFKSKTTDIKSCLKYGVDGFTVVMPVVAVKDAGELKSQMKKLGKVSKKETGVAFSASELDAENIKLILKTAGKAGLSSLTFAFGDEGEEEIRNKCEIIRRNKGKTEIRILGNVRTANAVATVISLGADKVITPFADEIAKDLAKSFGIKKVKLS